MMEHVDSWEGVTLRLRSCYRPLAWQPCGALEGFLHVLHWPRKNAPNLTSNLWSESEGAHARVTCALAKALHLSGLLVFYCTLPQAFLASVAVVGPFALRDYACPLLQINTYVCTE